MPVHTWLTSRREATHTALRYERFGFGLGDIVSIEAGEFEDSPSISPAYEELLEVMTHGLDKLEH